MVITIGGCRDFNDYKMFSNCMKEYLKTIDDLKNIVFLSGHCSGADEMVERFAFENQISLETFPADWKKYGKVGLSAGCWRFRPLTASRKNRRFLRQPALCFVPVRC